jgi:phosphoglycolate phosphatase
VGDGERDMQAARQAGMPGMVAGYGYIAATETPRDWPAMAWLDTPQDILRWL